MVAVYPSEDDEQPIAITHTDIEELSGGLELSDNLVNVCLRQFRHQMRAKERCVVVDALWLWTARVDVAAVAAQSEFLLHAEFVYVPICACRHWAGAIVCLHNHSYRILVLDSLPRSQSSFDPRPSCDVLVETIRTAWSVHRSSPCPDVDWVVVNGVPMQPNLVDCALYMVALFTRHNAVLPEMHLQRTPQWQGDFNHTLIQDMRDRLRQSILSCKR